MEYNNNSFTDIVVPQGSNANRIILFGVDQKKSLMNMIGESWEVYNISIEF